MTNFESTPAQPGSPAWPNWQQWKQNPAGDWCREHRFGGCVQQVEPGQWAATDHEGEVIAEGCSMLEARAHVEHDCEALDDLFDEPTGEMDRSDYADWMRKMEAEEGERR